MGWIADFNTLSSSPQAPIQQSSVLILGPDRKVGHQSACKLDSCSYPFTALTPLRQATHSLTHSLPHSLTPLLPHSLTPALPHSLTPSLPHSLTPSPPHLAHSLTHSLARSLNHTLTQSLTHSLTDPKTSIAARIVSHPQPVVSSPFVPRMARALDGQFHDAVHPTFRKKRVVVHLFWPSGEATPSKRFQVSPLFLGGMRASHGFVRTKQHEHSLHRQHGHALEGMGLIAEELLSQFQSQYSVPAPELRTRTMV